MNKTVQTIYQDHVPRGKAWIKAAATYYKAQLALKAAKQKEEEAKKALVEISEGHNAIGGGYRFTCIKVNGRINYKAIPELKEINVEEYRSSGSISWQLRKV